MQLIAAAVDAVQRPPVGRRDKLAVQAVGPRVIRAADRPADLAAVGQAQLRAAVPADVQEAPERLVLATYQHNRLAADPPPDKPAWGRDLVGAAGVVPFPLENVLELSLQNAGIGVTGAIQRRGEHIRSGDHARLRFSKTRTPQVAASRR